MCSRLWLLILACGALPAAAFELELPIALEDVGYQTFGVAPFGYHVAEHRYDGHPGFDFEFIPGRKVRAARGGNLRYTADIRDPALKTVTIEFSENGVNYQTFYTNIASLEPGIGNGAAVATGQVFGTPASVTGNPGTATTITYAMTHFQLADSRVNYGLTNPTPVSPERYFSPAARQTLALIWQQSQYHQMICEPYLSAPRGVLSNPVITRRWHRAAGGLADAVEFVCDYAQNNPNIAYRYRLFDGGGAVVETGNAFVTAVTGGTSSIDLTPSGGSLRRGVLYVKDGAMQLDYSSQGGNRPANLTGATQYAADAAVNCASASDALCFRGNVSPYRSGDTLSLGISIDWSKLIAGASTADLWVALQLPAGDMLFAHTDGQWLPDPKPFRSGLSASTASVALLAMNVPPTLPLGNYTMYAGLNQSGMGIEALSATLLSNIASSLLYLAP